MYLVLDGSTSLLQERIFINNKNMPVHSQMLYVNICSGFLILFCKFNLYKILFFY